MKLGTSIIPVAGIYYATIDLYRTDGAGLTPVEQEAIAMEGEPIVNVGGVIDNHAGLTFTLPVKDLSFPTQFPAQQKFAKADFADAKQRALEWTIEISARIDTALTDKRVAAASDSESLQVTTVDTTPD